MGSWHGILQRLAAPFGSRAAARQTRLYGVGAPRTGTHSLAAVFDRSIRSRHEPELLTVAEQLLAQQAGRLSFDGLREFVRRRDARLRLDVDSSHANVFLIEALLAEFADARFVLTMRDCYTWLDSALNRTLNTRWRRRAHREYLAFFFQVQDLRYSPHDEFLRQRGLLSVDCYLATWSRHNHRALTSIPPEKLLIVKTNELAAKLPQIAAFAGVAPERINRGFRAQDPARVRHGVLDEVDAAFLEDRVAAHCGELMRRFFPDIRSRKDALAP